MKPYEKFGKIVVKMLNSTVNLAVLILLLLLLVFGSYSMWDSHQVYQAADANQYAMYKPTNEVSEGFVDLKAINDEVMAWLTIYGTNVDYPVAQAEDNSKYVNTDIKGKYSLSGALFLDYQNAPDFSDFNSIIYGHHMDKQVMFGGIENFGDKAYFDGRRYGNLFHSGKEHGLEFFAFMHVDAYDFAVYNPRVSEDGREKFIDMLYEKASNTRDIGLTIEDNILLLSTCTSDSTNGRHILAARIVDETFINPFPEGEEVGLGIGGIDGQGGISILDRIPIWGWFVLWALLLLLILLIIDGIRSLTKKGKKKSEKESKEDEPKADGEEN
jgi:sortase, SrtB family